MACHTGREQRELLRVVRTPSGEVRFDPAGRANGRGAYLCRDEACITTATRRGALARALTGSIPPGLAAELIAELAPAARQTHPEMTIAGGTIGQE